MMAQKILALFLILSSYFSFSISTCEITYPFEIYSRLRIGRSYQYSGDTLTCFNITLNKKTQLYQEFIKPDSVVAAIEKLYIANSSISKLYANTFVGFQHCEKITLSNCSLHEIEPNTFLDWNNLKHLNISFNKLTSIDFYFPPNITYLYISHNNISHIKFLQNYNNLIEIDLSYNSIISIENFGPYNALRYLDLSHNNLLSLANITWKNEQVLDSLILSHNNLEYNPKITETIFVKYLNLSYNNISNFDCRNVTESINLSHNKFTEICNFSTLINNIDFSYNGITHIYEHTFKNLKKLKILNLSFNNMKIIYPGAFHDLIDLKHLDLSYNNISELPMGLFYHLEKLIKLSITKNRIEKLEHGVFTGLESLDMLYINENRIDNLDAIYPLKQLQELNIAFNNLYQLDVDQITNHLPKLSKINLNMPEIPCKELMAYLLEFKSKGITVEKGKAKYHENVNGLYCNSESNFKITKQETDEQKLECIANYLSGISVALFVILVVLVFVIVSTLFTLYRVCMEHRKQTKMDPNLASCSVKLLNENDSLN